ncbi:MAG: 50S ribosomal protein L28 [Chloroflexota bacterium]|nr:50S ribosomal protein L28 [Chloroflexota bacterium]
MAGRKKVTGVKPMFGNQRSFSMRATRRKYNPNMQSKRFYVPELDRQLQVQVTAGEIRTIDKIGLMEFLKRREINIKRLLD